MSLPTLGVNEFPLPRTAPGGRGQPKCKTYFQRMRERERDPAYQEFLRQQKLASFPKRNAVIDATQRAIDADEEGWKADYDDVWIG